MSQNRGVRQSGKYGEPWRIERHPTRLSQVVAYYADRIKGRDMDDDLSNERIMRGAACVNACEGIEDPADLRRQRDDALGVVRRFLELACADGWDEFAMLSPERSAVEMAQHLLLRTGGTQ
jgi:hypothetical protein